MYSRKYSNASPAVVSGQIKNKDKKKIQGGVVNQNATEKVNVRVRSVDMFHGLSAVKKKQRIKNTT